MLENQNDAGMITIRQIGYFAGKILCDTYEDKDIKYYFARIIMQVDVVEKTLPKIEKILDSILAPYYYIKLVLADTLIINIVSRLRVRGWNRCFCCKQPFYNSAKPSLVKPATTPPQIVFCKCNGAVYCSKKCRARDAKSHASVCRTWGQFYSAQELVPGTTVLMSALRNGENVKPYMRFIALINVTDMFGRTALYFAIFRRDMGTAKLLLESGADPNIDAFGLSLPFYCVKHMDYDMLKILLESGKVLGINRQYSIKIGRETKHYNIMEYLFYTKLTEDNGKKIRKYVKLLRQYNAKVNYVYTTG